MNQQKVQAARNDIHRAEVQLRAAKKSLDEALEPPLRWEDLKPGTIFDIHSKHASLSVYRAILIDDHGKPRYVFLDGFGGPWYLGDASGAMARNETIKVVGFLNAREVGK